MQIMKPKLVQERLLHDFVSQQKRFNPHCFQQPSKTARQMPVDEHGVAVHTVPGNVWNIEFSIDDADPTANGTNHVEQYCVVDVLGLMPNFPIKLHGRASRSSRCVAVIMFHCSCRTALRRDQSLFPRSSALSTPEILTLCRRARRWRRRIFQSLL